MKLTYVHLGIFVANIILGAVFVSMVVFGNSRNSTISTISSNIATEKSAITNLLIDNLSVSIPVPPAPEIEKIAFEEITEVEKEEVKKPETPANTTTPTPTPTPNPTPAPQYSYTATGCDDSFAATMLQLVNAYRVEQGKPELSLDSKLTSVACAHTVWMVENNKFSHTGFADSTPFERCERAGTDCDAENIAFNSNATPQKIFDQFKGSAGHNANMLGSHSVMGLGYKAGKLTQNFR
jgi:uncharacterized protein YkwD